MKICSKCKAENVFDEAQFCKNCGAPLNELADQPISKDEENKTDDNLDFVITESKAPDTPSLMDTPEDKKEIDKPAESNDELELTSTFDILDMGIEDEDIIKEPEAVEEIAPPVESLPEETPKSKTSDISWETKNQQSAPKSPDVETSSTTNLASQQEIQDAQAELRKIAQESKPKNIPHASPEKSPDTITPIDDPALQDIIPRKAQKSRGVAFYRKNNIQIVGNAFLHEGDEIVVNNKQYQLRPKKMDKKTTIGIFAAALILVLIVIGSQFIKSGNTDDGAIIGMVLNEKGQPFLEGAVVTIPSINKKTQTNAQGFFKFDLIPTGTYSITYELSNERIGEGNATVSGGQTTLSSFGNLRPKVYENKRSRKTSSTVAKKTTATKNNKTTSSQKKTTKETAAVSKKSTERGKIKLEANVENARLTLEGQILGAGNTIYTRIRSGNRKIKVDKAGYKDYTATVSVEPGQTTLVKANLIKTQQTKKKLTTADYIELGNDALKQNKYSEAIKEFDKAIKLSPGNAKTYEARAKAYVSSNEYELAADDYIRMGEIYRINKKANTAISAFTYALDLSPNNVNALIGRAGSKLDNAKFQSALNDYESILKIDKKQYSALYGSGISHFRQGDYKKAEKQFKKAYKINSNDPYLYQYLMLTYLARDNIKALRKTYAQFKGVAGPGEMAEFKSSSRNEPILRLIKEEDR